jgi:hypothetical protein
VAGLEDDGVRLFAFAGVFGACVSVDTRAGLADIPRQVVEGSGSWYERESDMEVDW